jgi:hypothetical protein
LNFFLEDPFIKTGSKSRVSRVEVNRPPITTLASGLCRQQVHEDLVEISFDHGHQLVRDLKLRGMSLLVWVEYMKPQMSLNQLGHEPIECSPATHDVISRPRGIAIRGAPGSFYAMECYSTGE